MKGNRAVRTNCTPSRRHADVWVQAKSFRNASMGTVQQWRRARGRPAPTWLGKGLETRSRTPVTTGSVPREDRIISLGQQIKTVQGLPRRVCSNKTRGIPC